MKPDTLSRCRTISKNSLKYINKIAHFIPVINDWVFTRTNDKWFKDMEMKKLFAVALLAPLFAFGSDYDKATEVTSEVRQNVNLQYIWHEISYGDFIKAKSHINNEISHNFDDVMYISLTKLYIAIKRHDNREFNRIQQEIDTDTTDYFGIYD